MRALLIHFQVDFPEWFSFRCRNGEKLTPGMTTIDQPDSGKAGAEAMVAPQSLADATELDSG